MKRVKTTFLAPNEFTKDNFEQSIQGILELEHYGEKTIERDKNIMDEHSIDTLLEGALEFANGIWISLKGLGKMSIWSAVIIWSGLKYMYDRGIGSKDKKAKPK